MTTEQGAVDLFKCPRKKYNGDRWRCDCDLCADCGFRKHSAIHGPLFGQPPGSKPWGHVFVPKETS